MFRAGTIIRLIDVVLIVLFGFLSITDVKNKSQIKLPSNYGQAKQEVEQQIVFLNIQNDHHFSLINQETTNEIEGIAELEQRVVQLNNDYRNNHKQMILVIEPDAETMIQTTVDVMDLCERHQILKNLSYPRINLEQQ
ncbi:MAG: biopolymer transporter ExbD [candidate division KSB1 bacterium]|nr:biopolymer transporter ExbD [candidate division KSB1 bacterium]MDZ7335491.1 biopolymer transporter ExbD [candidate division KSB1 bacterium]MDZ7376491.1 biopolymer transporter ExbD [candidate division KSB1 bacterium]MDZ7399221.1 biopolymer transporter ExbD [candidate division KSB1 bacterium]